MYRRYVLYIVKYVVKYIVIYLGSSFLGAAFHRLKAHSKAFKSKSRAYSNQLRTLRIKP